MQKQFSIWRLLICLAVCVGLILGCFPQKAEAVALEAALGIGVAACLILMTAGVVFNPKTVEDIKAIGQSFQTYMYQWGTEAEKLDEVEEWFGGLSVLDPDDGNDGWGNRKTKITIARGILTGISLWIAAAIAGTYRPSLPSSGVVIPSDYFSTYYLSNPSSSGANVSPQNPLSPFNPNDTAIKFDGKVLYLSSLSSLIGKGCVSSSVFKLGDGYYNLQIGTITPYFPYPVTSSYKNFCYAVYRYDPVSASGSFISSNYVRFVPSNNHGLPYECPDLNFYASSSYDYYVCLSYSGKCSYYDEFMGFELENTLTVVPSEAPSADPVFVGDVATDVESGNIAAEEIPLQDIDYSLALPEGQTVLESIQSISQSMSAGDMTLEEYQEMTYAGSASAETPVWTLNLPLSQTLTYDQGAAAEPLMVEATVTDGGTVTYEWYRYGTDAEGEVYPADVFATGNTFTPPTDVAQTAYYYCRAINTDPDGYVAWDYSNSIAVQVNPVTDPGTDTDPDAGTDTDSDNLTAEQVGSAVGDALDQSSAKEEQKINNTGNDVSQQLLNAIPDYSSRFLPAVRNLSDSLGYTGTSCVLTMPAITVPAVSDLFSETRILDEQQINFEDFFNKMPEVLMKLTRALFDIAVVFFCLREFNHTIQQVMTGFKTPGDHWEEV